MAVALLGLVGLPLGGIAALLVPIAMGALFRQDAFASGALVTVPGLAVALARALTTSWVLVVLTLVFGPISLFIGGVLGRVGAALLRLTRPIDVPGDAVPGSIADVNARAAVEQRRRGLILVAVFASIVVSGYAANDRINAVADRRARTVERKLLRAEPAYHAEDLVRLGDKVGAFMQFRPEPETLVAEVSYAWATRCVFVTVKGDRRSHIERSRGSC